LAAEARSWVTLALERIDATTHPDLQADLLLALGALGSGDRILEMAVSAQQIFERIGDDAGSADALYLVAWHSHLAGRHDVADDALSRASEIYRKCGPRLALAKCINMQGILAERHRDLDAARALFREAIEMFQAIGDDRRVGGALSNLASCESVSENYPQADRYNAEALAILSRKKNVEDLVILYGNILITRVALGDIPGAREAGLAGMRRAREMGDERYIAELALDLGSVAARSGRTNEAARLFGFARNRLESLGLGRIAISRSSAEVIKETLDAGLEPAEIERLTSEGAVWSEKQAIEAAMNA
jgi:tetratricopeptide (TPR) repeat protein